MKLRPLLSHPDLHTSRHQVRTRVLIIINKLMIPNIKTSLVSCKVGERKESDSVQCQEKYLCRNNQIHSYRICSTVMVSFYFATGLELGARTCAHTLHTYVALLHMRRMHRASVITCGQSLPPPLLPVCLNTISDAVPVSIAVTVRGISVSWWIMA